MLLLLHILDEKQPNAIIFMFILPFHPFSIFSFPPLKKPMAPFWQFPQINHELKQNPSFQILQEFNLFITPEKLPPPNHLSRPTYLQAFITLQGPCTTDGQVDPVELYPTQGRWWRPWNQATQVNGIHIFIGEPVQDGSTSSGILVEPLRLMG